MYRSDVYIFSYIIDATLTAITQSTDCPKKSKSVAYNIDYERLAQEIVRIQKTTPENVTDLSNNTEVKIRETFRMRPLPLLWEIMQRRRIQLPQSTQLLKNTTGESTGTTIIRVWILAMSFHCQREFLLPLQCHKTFMLFRSPEWRRSNWFI